MPLSNILSGGGFHRCIFRVSDSNVKGKMAVYRERLYSNNHFKENGRGGRHVSNFYTKTKEVISFKVFYLFFQIAQCSTFKIIIILDSHLIIVSDL